MRTAAAPDAGPADEGATQFPAYGPIEASLGYLLFYVLVERVTPSVVTLFSETVPVLPPSLVGFGLATVLWFILLMTGIDQLRRQLAALGVGSYDEYQLRVWARVTPSSLQTTGYLLALVVGTAVAVVTFDRAIDALLSLIPVVTTAGSVVFGLTELFVLLVFFLSYSAATHSLDRLVIGAVRALTPE